MVILIYNITQRDDKFEKEHIYSDNDFGVFFVFYGSNSWSYTRLGKITDKNSSELEKLLSAGNVLIIISMER